MTTEPNNPLSLSGARARKLRALGWHFASTATSPSQGRRACLKTQQRDRAGPFLPPGPNKSASPALAFREKLRGLPPGIQGQTRTGDRPSREGETCGLVASFKEEGVPFLSEVPQGRKSRFPRLICCLGLPDLPPQVQRQTRRADLRTCCKSQRNCVSFKRKLTSPQVPLPFSELPKSPPHI